MELEEEGDYEVKEVDNENEEEDDEDELDKINQN